MRNAFRDVVRGLLRPRTVLLLIAVFLVLVTGLHALEFAHEHPHEIFGNIPEQAWLHGGEKKYWWMVILVACLFITSVATSLFAGNQLLHSRIVLLLSSSSCYLRADISKLFDPIRKHLREGRLERKICE